MQRRGICDVVTRTWLVGTGLIMAFGSVAAFIGRDVLMGVGLLLAAALTIVYGLTVRGRQW